MVKLYVEGGGDSKNLKIQCQEGLRKFLNKSGLKENPRIVACGGRSNAYDRFCTAIKNGESAFLLVDSEEALAKYTQEPKDNPQQWKPWSHLAQRQGDSWEKPDNSDDIQCHLMVECMENWFLADRDTLEKFFGQEFHTGALPSANSGIEKISKKTAYDALAKATAHCKTKGQYGKGNHSFKLLGLVSSQKVMDASPWAKRFIDALQSSK